MHLFKEHLNAESTKGRVVFFFSSIFSSNMGWDVRGDLNTVILKLEALLFLGVCVFVLS